MRSLSAQKRKPNTLLPPQQDRTGRNSLQFAPLLLATPRGENVCVIKKKKEVDQQKINAIELIECEEVLTAADKLLR